MAVLLQFNVYDADAGREVIFAIDGLDPEMSDAEALDVAERMRDTDYVQRAVGDGGEILNLSWAGLHRVVNISPTP